MKYLVLIVLLFISFNSNAIIIFQKERPKFIPGFIVFQNNDTLFGSFCLKNEEKIIYSKDGIFNHSKFNADTVSKIFLAAVSQRIYTIKCFMEFDYLPKIHKIQRLIYKGKNNFYDNNLLIEGMNSEKIGWHFVRLQENNLEEIEKDNESLLNPKKTLINYYNKKYKKNYSAQDFNSSIDIIKEIDNQ